MRATLAAALVLLISCGEGELDVRPADDARPWSVQLGSFRYLESVGPYEQWLRQEGIPAWTVGRSTFDDGRWFEVRAGSAMTRDELAPVVAQLRELGFEALEVDDRAAWAAEEFTDFSAYQLYGYDTDRTPTQLGPTLHEVALAVPCHPRFELVSFAAAHLGGELNDDMQEVVRPAGTHELVESLVDSDLDIGPVVAHAELRDLVTGTQVGVSIGWRSPLPDKTSLGRSTHDLGGPHGPWNSRPLAEPGQVFDEGPEPVWLAWSDDAARVIVVTADDPAGWVIVPELFDRDLCNGGVFSFAALWRPLGVLPTSFGLRDVPVAVETAILGDDYVRSKDNARWARKLRGRWQYTTSFLHDRDDLWTASVFDLETTKDAQLTHGRLYTGNMSEAYNSYGNEWAKAMGWDAIYRTRVRGLPAWYIDKYRLSRHKELNFHVGPFIFAFGSWVLDADPLLMEDMIERASQLPPLGGGW